MNRPETLEADAKLVLAAVAMANDARTLAEIASRMLARSHEMVEGVVPHAKHD